MFENSTPARKKENNDIKEFIKSKLRLLKLGIKDRRVYVDDEEVIAITKYIDNSTYTYRVKLKNIETIECNCKDNEMTIIGEANIKINEKGKNREDTCRTMQLSGIHGLDDIFKKIVTLGKLREANSDNSCEIKRKEA